MGSVELIQITHANLVYVCLGGFVVFFSVLSLLIKEKLYLGECVLAIVFGIGIGPIGGNFISPETWGDLNRITLEVMRVILATGVFAIGVELPKSYMYRQWKSLAVLIIPTMLVGWFVCAGLIIALFPKLNFLSSLVISACLTPTDPILASAILMGRFAQKHVPTNIRLLLSAESAANDGLAYPFLSLSLYLTLESSKRIAVEKWFLIGVCYQVIFGVVLGSIIGTAFRYILRHARKQGYIDRDSFVAQYLALAIFSSGISNLLGSDDLLTAFAAGNAVSWDGDFNTETEDDFFAAILDLILNCAGFIYIGTWIPFGDFNLPSVGITPGRLVALGICILLARRIPVVLLLYRSVPRIRDWREALFCGHFGPMGVGAVYISTLALTQLPAPRNPPQSQLDVLTLAIRPIVAFMVIVSLIIHGLSIPLSRVGLNIRHRTLSMTQTWTTSRPASPTRAPDWLHQTEQLRMTPQGQAKSTSEALEGTVESSRMHSRATSRAGDDIIVADSPLMSPSVAALANQEEGKGDLGTPNRVTFHG